jgi:gas vesicle protein
MAKASIPVGIGLGIIIGASAALILAPHSGKITRNKVKNKYQEKLEDLNEAIIDAQKYAEELRAKISN